MGEVIALKLICLNLYIEYVGFSARNNYSFDTRYANVFFLPRYCMNGNAPYLGDFDIARRFDPSTSSLCKPIKSISSLAYLGLYQALARMHLYFFEI